MKKLFNMVLGNLKHCVKWGVGVDNVDFNACKKHEYLFQIPASVWWRSFDIINCLLTLTRQTSYKSKSVSEGIWFKPTGRSLSKCCINWFGDTGRCSKKMFGI